MKTMMNRLLKTCCAPTALAAIVAFGTMGAAPKAALADRNDHRDDRRSDSGGHDDRGHDDHDRGDNDRIGFRLNLNFGGGPVFERVPVYENRAVQVWVEPVYRTVSERQWVGAEYRTVIDRVWVPDRYETRDVVRYDHGRRYTDQERVLVSRGHYEDCSRQELVCDGHYETVTRQECVAPGHWETHYERVLCD